MAATASTTLVGVAALAVLAVFGGYTASFACLVIERRGEGRSPGGRSSCVCGAPIPMYRNIPMVTWLAQRGRAACCDARIPVWYVVAEAGTAVAPVVGALVASRAPLLGALMGILVSVALTAAARGYARERHQRVAATSEGDD